MSFDIAAAECAATDLILALAEVIYYIADDAAAASALVGVESSVYGAHVGEPGQNPIRTAALGARLVGLTTRIATYAKEGIWPASQNDFMDALTDFEVSAELLKGREGPCLFGPDQVARMPEHSAAVLLEVLTSAQARLAIDRGSNITVPMLAALAGVSEKTVRMASNPNNDRPLKTVKEGAATFIQPDDALEWLGRRGDFRPTRYFVSEGSRPQLTTFLALSTHLQAVRTERGESVDTLAEALGWSIATSAAYERLDKISAPSDLANFQPCHLAQLARHLDIHEPVDFARETYPLIATAYGEAVAKEQLS